MLSCFLQNYYYCDIIYLSLEYRHVRKRRNNLFLVIGLVDLNLVDHILVHSSKQNSTKKSSTFVQSHQLKERKENERK
jgi:hypothetical protein